MLGSYEVGHADSSEALWWSQDPGIEDKINGHFSIVRLVSVKQHFQLNKYVLVWFELQVCTSCGWCSSSFAAVR